MPSPLSITHDIGKKAYCRIGKAARTICSTQLHMINVTLVMDQRVILLKVEEPSSNGMIALRMLGKYPTQPYNFALLAACCTLCCSATASSNDTCVDKSPGPGPWPPCPSTLTT